MITLKIQQSLQSQGMIGKLSYAGIEIVFPMNHGEGGLIGEINERVVSQMFNLFSIALQDLKKSTLAKHEADKDRIKFVGVNYD